MVEWLQLVFRTWGGFIAGFGLLLASVAGFLLTSRLAVLRLGTSLAILIALGRFLISNVLIRSDYIVFVAALFAMALVATSLFLWQSLQRPTIANSRRI